MKGFLKTLVLVTLTALIMLTLCLVMIITASKRKRTQLAQPNFNAARLFVIPHPVTSLRNFSLL